MNGAVSQELWVQLVVVAFVVVIAGLAVRLALQRKVPRQHRHEVSTIGLTLLPVEV